MKTNMHNIVMRWLRALSAALLTLLVQGRALAQTFGYSGGETDITLDPGMYDITAYGAQGGADASGVIGGQGAEMEATFYFPTSTTLTVMVGGAGGNGSPYSMAGVIWTVGGGGGGGGSFVADGSTPLVVAGGGGGSYCNNGIGYSGGAGSIGANGGTGGGVNGGPGGSGGNGGQGGGAVGGYLDAGGGGGGGWYTDAIYVGQLAGRPGASYFDGGAGGLNGRVGYGNNAGNGGYGGGGGACQAGGGGGGYSGGGGGTGGLNTKVNNTNGVCLYNGGGGGGGSYIDSSAITVGTELAGIQSGNGLVEIEAIPEPSTWAMAALGLSALLVCRRRKA